MTRKLIQIGNSLALIIDKSMLDLLNVSPDISFKITTDGKNLILTPQTALNTTNKASDLMNALEKVNKKYENNLRRLCE